MEKIKILAGAFIVCFLLLLGKEQVFAAESVDSAAQSVVESVAEMNGDSDITLELENVEITSYSSSSYVKTHTYNMMNNSTGEAAKWYMTIYYDYSDGSYVEIEEVTIDYEVVSGPVVIWRTYFPEDSIFIEQHASYASVYAYYDVTFSATGKKYYMVIYAEVDYWGDFVFEMYER